MAARLVGRAVLVLAAVRVADCEDARDLAGEQVLLGEASENECRQVDWEGVPAVELSDRGGQDFVRVLTSIGGTVDRLKLSGQEVLLPLKSGEEARSNHKLYHKGGVLLPWANRVAHGTYNYFGKQMPLVVNDQQHDSALHGLLEGREMKVESCCGTSASLVYVFTGKEAPNAGYPFPGLRIQLDYKLDGGRLLFGVRADVPSEAEGPVPFNFGWHSYFKVSDVSKTKLEFDRRGGRQWRLMRTDANLIPTGPTDPFHGFNGTDEIGGTATRPTYYDNEWVAHDPGTGAGAPEELRLRVRGPGAKTAVLSGDARLFRYVQVFTGSESVFNESAVAVELMTCAANAFNTGDCSSAAGMYIQPGASWAAEIRVALE